MDNSNGKLKLMLELIVRNLVDYPDSVVINDTASDGNTIIFTVHVAKGEVGKVIGKKGKTAIAIRSILEPAAAKYRHRVHLEIADD